MDKPIDITSEFTITNLVWSDWADEDFSLYAENYPNVDLYDSDQWGIILDEEKDKFEAFLTRMKQKYPKLDFASESDTTVIIFQKKYKTLREYIDMIVEVINYLEAHDIPWYMEDLNFQFKDRYATGIIRFDNDKSVIKIYYLDPKYGTQFEKIKIPYGKTKKMM